MRTSGEERASKNEGKSGQRKESGLIAGGHPIQYSLWKREKGI